MRQHPAGAGVAVDDLARGRDLRVGEHVGRGGSRRRREQRDRGLAGTEHEAAHAAASIARGSTGPGHRSGSTMRRNPSSARRRRAIPAPGIDEVRLHVDDRRGAAERLVGGLEVERRGFGHLVERVPVRRVDRAERCRGRAPVGEVGRGRDAEPARGTGRGPGVPSQDFFVPRRVRQREVLVAREWTEQWRQERVQSAADRAISAWFLRARRAATSTSRRCEWSTDARSSTPPPECFLRTATPADRSR